MLKTKKKTAKLPKSASVDESDAVSLTIGVHWSCCKWRIYFVTRT